MKFKNAISKGFIEFGFNILKMFDFIENEIYLFKNDSIKNLVSYAVFLNKKPNKKKVLKFIEEKNIDEKFKKYINEIIKRI